MRRSELLVLAYFVYVTGAAWCVGAGTGRRLRATAIAASVIGLVLALPFAGGRTAATVRDWIPVAYLLIGYWLPALLTRTPNLALEQRLLAIDDRLLVRTCLRSRIERAPRAWLEYLELSYLLCYPLVPAAFAILYFSGPIEGGDRFWTTVLLAVYPCYGLLPWLPTRAPRAVEGPSELDRRELTVRRLNLHVLQHGSVTWNTFPSGHAAGGVGAALSVMLEEPVAGAALLLLAISIMAGSVVGRYHYAADAIAGAAVAIAATILAGRIL